jgi:hypothetical protein
VANGNGNWKIPAAVIFSSIVLFSGGLIAWGQLTTEVDTLKTKVAGVAETKITIAELKKDVEYIREKQDKQDEKLDKILEKLP